MNTWRGIPVSPGVAIGPALVLDTEGVRIPRRRVSDELVPQEIARLQEALITAAQDARRQQSEVAAKHGKNLGNIFNAHAVLLADPVLKYDIETLIRSESYSAEYAVARHLRSKRKE